MKIKQMYQLFSIFSLIAILTVACHSSDLSNSISKNCRMIQHKAGETCVPFEPQRVIVLDEPILANAIALGTKPIGATLTSPLFDKNTPPYLVDEVDYTPVSVGSQSQPNIEKILQLKPDLILALEFTNPYDTLSQIAPTVIIEWQDAGHWKAHLLKVAQALGKTFQAQQLLADYNTHIVDLRNALNQPPEQIEVSLAYIGGNTPFIRSDVKNSFSGSILEDVGLARPPSQNIVHPDYQIEISEEMIPSLDADVLFLFAVNDERGKKTWNKLKNHPLWQKLKVVQNNQVYLVDFYNWRSRNIFAANSVIDDLFRYLVKES
ncbi:iron-siderophore ABC transporter substrate-binding protein [Cyanobacterium aponinum UTEX 3221]|uniref:iron-siderophore ABC transporter substrate-binding protein n=1 Tax=Cyanobacterium aponinum TaxID=379064 RepID=UPI002B4BF668|nr:iron-siderophore ABC transporter substrate-binding protein [Cyanobacterium aponinum]WRL38565.1 iron-siderophore ABC transporter substrate-binding protein [Cyanobacterium aponinum UTEX 3221]